MFIMSEFNIDRYDHTIPADVADQVSTIFERNYPESHSTEARARDLSRYSGSIAVQSILGEMRSIYTGRENDQIIGMMEVGTADVGGGVYEQLIWLMIERTRRGEGFSGMLHRKFIADASERAKQRLPKPSAATLNVHKGNPAVSIYNGWGYKVVESKGDKLIMVRPLPGE